MQSIQTNVAMKVSPTHIDLSPEQLQTEQGIALIADIPKPIGIEPGNFAYVPTSLHITGDGRTIALIEIYAGATPVEDHQNFSDGDFIVPKPDASVQVFAKVLNRTGATLMIRPGVQLGVMNFHAIATEDHKLYVPTAPANDPSAPLRISAVYEPEFINKNLIPDYAAEGASGMDLRADLAETITITPGERQLIKTGLRVAVPQGYEAQIRPRSGLALNHGVTVLNSPGTIDAGFTGICGVILTVQGNEPFVVNPGDRIAQIVFAPIAKVLLDMTDSLDQTIRGEGGFGSTGRS